MCLCVRVFFFLYLSNFFVWLVLNIIPFPMPSFISWSHTFYTQTVSVSIRNRWYRIMSALKVIFFPVFFFYYQHLQLKSHIVSFRLSRFNMRYCTNFIFYFGLSLAQKCSAPNYLESREMRKEIWDQSVCLMGDVRNGL